MNVYYECIIGCEGVQLAHKLMENAKYFNLHDLIAFSIHIKSAVYRSNVHSFGKISRQALFYHLNKTPDPTVERETEKYMLEIKGMIESTL